MGSPYLYKFKESTNNLERRYNAKTFNVTALQEAGDGIRDLGDTVIQPDDILVIGTIPGGSLVLGMQVLVNTAFDGTTPLFDFFFTEDFPELNLKPITTGVDVSPTNANATIHIDLPTSGQVNGKGIWFGDRHKHGNYYIVAQFKGATEATLGDIDVLMSYDRFVTNEGAY